jgi:hypothetical protein
MFPPNELLGYENELSSTQQGYRLVGPVTGKDTTGPEPRKDAKRTPPILCHLLDFCHALEER